VSIVIKIDWNEVYSFLCDDCKKKFREYVKQKAIEQAIEKQFPIEKKEKKKAED